MVNSNVGKRDFSLMLGILQWCEHACTHVIACLQAWTDLYNLYVLHRSMQAFLGINYQKCGILHP